MSMTTFHGIAKGMELMVQFKHIATGAQVEFPAFITEINDQYRVEWGGGGPVYGRMDPVKTYQSTTRVVNMAFDVLSYNMEKGIENFITYSKLVQMLYPVYSSPIKKGTQGSRTLLAPPYIRLKFSNFVSNHSTSTDEPGLLGCISGLTFNPVQESGFFITPDNELVPKNYSVNFTFEPQHESVLGWEGKKFLTRNFPYNQMQVDTDGVSLYGSNNDDVRQSREEDHTNN